MNFPISSSYIIKSQKIHDDLINNRPYEGGSETLSDSLIIKQKIKELESTLDDLLSGVLDLKKQISDLGIDEIVDWDEYFAKQKQSLMDAIEQMEKELQDNISYDDNNNEDDIPF